MSFMPLKRKGLGKGGCAVDEDGKLVRLVSRINRQARELRRNQTPAEKTLWNVLRKKKLHGLKFYRQVGIDRFVADFYCPKKAVIVEVDGGIHCTKAQKEHDEIRSDLLQERGFRILRVRNEDVLFRLEDVLDEIARFCGVDV